MSENERDADMIRMLTQILASAQGRPALGVEMKMYRTMYAEPGNGVPSLSDWAGHQYLRTRGTSGGLPRASTGPQGRRLDALAKIC